MAMPALKEQFQEQNPLFNLYPFLQEIHTAHFQYTPETINHLILSAGMKLMECTLSFAGECDGDLFTITTKMRRDLSCSFRLPIPVHADSFLKNMFGQMLPYCDRQVEQDPLVPPPLRSHLLRSLVAIPVRANGRQFGFLFTDPEAGSSWSLDETKRTLVEIFQMRISELLHHINGRASMKKDAETDPLTLLKNRRGLSSYLEEAIHRRVSNDFTMLLLIDLDHLKRINDTYGHAVGDSAIQAVAQCLHSQENDSCKAFRIGGEEFILLLTAPSPTHALRAAEEIQRSLSVYKMPGGSLTVSIGVSYFGPRPGPGGSLDELLANADEALYQAKHNGRNRVEIWRM